MLIEHHVYFWGRCEYISRDGVGLIFPRGRREVVTVTLLVTLSPRPLTSRLWGGSCPSLWLCFLNSRVTVSQSTPKTPVVLHVVNCSRRWSAQKGIWCNASSPTLDYFDGGGDDSLLLFLQDLWEEYMFLSVGDLCPTPEMQLWEPSFLTLGTSWAQQSSRLTIVTVC